MEEQLGMVRVVRPSIDMTKPHRASFMSLITKPHTADISYSEFVPGMRRISTF